MKKLILFLILGVLLINLVSAWSYDGEHHYGNAHAYVRISGTYPNCDGNTHGSYCAGRWYTDVSHEGDKFWIAYKVPSWEPLTGTDDWGPSGYKGPISLHSISDGRVYLDENGNVPKFVLCAWDYDYSGGDWAWVAKCAGYIGAGYLDGKKNVECYDNSDCSSGEICDKSGDWTTWKCVPDPCKYVTCEDKCQNSVRYYDGYCKDGECVYKTETCEFGCKGDFCAEDPCKGVECNDKCENSIWYHDGHCVNGRCVYDSKDTCKYGCQGEPNPMLAIIVGEGMCKSSPCEGVTCDDYCSGTTLFYDGKCVNGKCTGFKEKKYAEECGWKPWYQNTWVWIGGVIFIISIIIGITYYRRGR